MLRVSVDIFSGRPNPTWIVTADAISKRLLGAIKEDRRLASRAGSGFQGLGFRGVRVEVIGAGDFARATGLPRPFVLGGSAGELYATSWDFAARLIETMTKAERIVLPEHALTPISKRLRTISMNALLAAQGDFARETGPVRTRVGGRRETVRDPRCEKCSYELTPFNPRFWNVDPRVQNENNCYNYAANWRTMTNAQPGRASGRATKTMSCTAVSSAARSDGLARGCQCLFAAESARSKLALVIWPDWDYHWFRQHAGGFWGHKPGHTAAKNTDNRGVIIRNPEVCERGDYSQFCGYFYAGRSASIV